jgi:hypothetical protein
MPLHDMSTFAVLLLSCSASNRLAPVLSDPSGL